MTSGRTISGGCLCGGVRYRARVAPEQFARGVVNCFCGQCRKTSGHHVAAFHAFLDDFQLCSAHTLNWYESSPNIKRGFCQTCGGNLFWRDHAEELISIMAGTADTPTGMVTTQNIYVDDASDYQIIPELK